MNQYDLHVIILQQQEQVAAIQAQIQALLAARAGRGGERSHKEVAKPPVFSGEAEKVSEFVTACKLYMKARMIGSMVEKQV